MKNEITVKNILILDNTLSQISVLSGFNTLIFKTNYYGYGEFALNVNLNQLSAEELIPGRIIYLDDKRCGLIETVSVNRSTNKMGEVVTATGFELKDIIRRRVCLAPEGMAKNEFAECTTENIIYELIDRCITNPTDIKRKIDIFTLATEKGIGTERSYETVNYSLAYDIYVKLLPLDELGLRSVANLDTKTAQFEVYKGLDRTIDQTQNPPAVFSLKLGSAIQNNIYRDESSAVNFVYSGDWYEGAERNFITLPTENIPEGIERSEEIVVDKTTCLTEDLINNAQTVLNNKAGAMTISSTMGRGEPDYELGDLVTFLDYRKGEYQNIRVCAIEYKYSGQNPAVKTVDFGGAKPDIAKIFKEKIAPLEKEYLK